MASSAATPATMAMRRVVIPISFIARDGQSAGRRCPAAPSGANRAPVKMHYRDKRVPTASHGVAVSINGGSRQGPMAATACKRLMAAIRSDEHTSELQSLMRNSYAVFYLKTKI